jgi:hypothetical protein
MYKISYLILDFKNVQILKKQSILRKCGCLERSDFQNRKKKRTGKKQQQKTCRAGGQLTAV